MSVESLAIAMHHSRAKGAQLLVLLGIANHDGDGGAWPAMGTLARYARVDVRTAQRAVRRLEQLGEIRTWRNGGGTNATPETQRPNRYEFRLACPPACDRSSQHRVRGVPAIIQPVLFDDGGDPPAQVSPPGAGVTGGATQAPPEPSYNHETKTDRASDVSQRARARVAPATCPTTDRPHRYNPVLGYCADCGGL